ncbi:MAG: phosphatase PAP2 family protein [Firmicutes bacterium]|nr:phosphatase PAP2 family protein [Bacillota bacterium]
MKLSKVIFVLLFCFTIYTQAYAQFNYPDNFRQSREMILEDDHYTTGREADKLIYECFFKPDFVFKERINPEKLPPFKRQFKEPMSLMQIIVDRLKPENIFDFYPLTKQLNTPERIATAASLGYLMDNDRKVYNDLESGMSKSNFWKNNGSWLSSIADGFAEVSVAGILALSGNKKNQQVAQMLMESALSLRVVYIKRVLGVTRPSELVSNVGMSFNYDSFPSGHTSVAFSMATILGEAYNLKWLTYPLALMSGLSRIQQNTHWPSDVLAGGILGHLEARTILARHGYIGSTDIAESHVWDNTRVDIDAEYRMFYDDYANIDNSKEKILDRIGRLVWRWHITQKLSPDVYMQMNYHWRGQIPSIVSYDAMEDVILNPRFIVKLGSRAILQAEYLYSKIQFQDFGTSPHLDERAQLPPGLDYINVYGEKRFTGGILYKLSPTYYLKPSYSFSTFTYDKYNYLYSNGRDYSVEFGTSPEKKRPTNFTMTLSTGNENSADPLYSYNRNDLNTTLTQDLGNHYIMKASYIYENRKYKNWHPVGFEPEASWNVAGAEITRKFTDSWNGEIGYYRRALNTGIPGWAYKKNIYFIQLNNKF